jgi:hypothetical protein
MPDNLAILTNAGLQACLDAGVSGFKVNITSFQIGSDVGFLPAVDDVAVHTFVYQGQADELTFVINNPNQITYRILLDQSSGTFLVGNIGLFLEDGTLFALVVLPAATLKVQQQAPEIAGNFKAFDILVSFANLNSLVQFEINEAFPASLPFVNTEVGLPDPTNADFNLYVVSQNSLFNNLPTLAYSDGAIWTYLVLGAQNFQLYAENFVGGTNPQIAGTAWNAVAVGDGGVITGNGQRSVTLGLASTEGTDNVVGAIGSTVVGLKNVGSNLVVFGYQNVGGTALAHQFNLVIGGSNNLVQALASTILGGQNNQISANNAVVIGGSYGLADILGQQVFSMGRFAITGDAQRNKFILRATTLNSVQTEMLINGTDRLILHNNQTWLFTVQIVAQRTDVYGECAAWKFEGLINCLTGTNTITLVGEPSSRLIASTSPNWTAVIFANPNYGSLSVLIAGDTAKTIHWVSYVETVGVQ